jgi:hypothetical protein
MKSTSEKSKKQVGMPVKTKIKSGTTVTVGNDDNNGVEADIEIFG